MAKRRRAASDKDQLVSSQPLPSWMNIEWPRKIPREVIEYLGARAAFIGRLYEDGDDERLNNLINL